MSDPGRRLRDPAGAVDGGCTVRTRFTDSYPPTRNEPAETASVLGLLTAAHGPERVRVLDVPGMASEDFAYVLEAVPGTLVFLGARPAHVPAAGAPAMHSELATFDDGVLGLQAATLADLAWHRLTRA